MVLVSSARDMFVLSTRTHDFSFSFAGTDATIAEHIQKVIDREYVMKQRDGNVEYLVPSTLGIGLVEGYNAIGFERSLCKPDMRRLVSFEFLPFNACSGS